MATRTLLNTGGELRGSGRVSSSCSSWYNAYVMYIYIYIIIYIAAELYKFMNAKQVGENCNIFTFNFFLFLFNLWLYWLFWRQQRARMWIIFHVIGIVWRRSCIYDMPILCHMFCRFLLHQDHLFKLIALKNEIMHMHLI